MNVTRPGVTEDGLPVDPNAVGEQLVAAALPTRLALLRRRLWAAVPPRKIWPRLLRAPSSYVLLLAAAATLGAKIHAASALSTDSVVLVGLRASLIDIALYLGLAACLAFLESRRALLAIFTVPIATTVFAAAFANAMYLIIAGEQGSRAALVDLWERQKDAQMVLSEQFEEPEVVRSVTYALVAFVAVPVLAHLVLWWRARAGYRWGNALARARACAFLGGGTGVLALVLPAPTHYLSHKLGRSLVVELARGANTELPEPKFDGWDERAPVSARDLGPLKKRRPPDVVLVVLESVRYDFTSLASSTPMAETPHLAALAARGWSATHTRSVLPHTTKSLFSILCGRTPVMQKAIVEVSSNTPVQCLPRVLRNAGYRTKFIQSAVGTFEQRPRLIDKFGFAEFNAFEDLGGPRVGYVGSEDGPLANAALRWLDEQEGHPAFITVLTSATHHPYRLPRSVQEKARRLGKRYDEPRYAYARLVEAADAMLGDLIAGLERRGRLNDTVIVAVADHGEGFGDHGVRQHDNNYYEESLRVPFVIAGPHVEQSSFAGNASLLDVTPTLLGVLRVKPQARVLEGYDLRLAPPPAETPRHFGCHAPLACRGFVSEAKKVVVVPESGDRFYFDLKADPEEREPRVLTPELVKRLPALDDIIDGRRVEEWPIRYARVDAFEPWLCPAETARCLHPKAARKYRR